MLNRSANKKLKKTKTKKPIKITVGLIGFLILATVVPLVNIPLFGLYNNKKNNDKTRNKFEKDQKFLAASKEKLLKENPNAIIPNVALDFHAANSGDSKDVPLIPTVYDNYPFKIVERLKKAKVDSTNWEEFNDFIYKNLDRNMLDDILSSFMSFYPVFHGSWLSELTERILLYRYQKIGIVSGFFKQYHAEVDNAYFVNKDNFAFVSSIKADLIAVHKLFGNVPTEVGISVRTSANSKIMIDPQTKGVVLTNASIFLESSAGSLSPYTSIYVKTNSTDDKNVYDYFGKALTGSAVQPIPSFPLTGILYSIINDRNVVKNDIQKYFYEWTIPVLINFFTGSYYDQQNIGKKPK
ncbi:hypothetical protein [[Mycoplasma] imitans]|uniref:hypothetical protein n=1 Tax=[Mycoplasma] imitans TaxID=29560 RepID=UPI000485B7FF|nr:hypothetical protein [[Mycoplasma] imitans]